MKSIKELIEELSKYESELEISERRVIIETGTIHKKALLEKKNKWIKSRWLKVSDAEMAAIESKIRQGECHDAGEHCLTVRSFNYCYLIEIMNVAENPEYYVLVKERIL